MAETYKVCVSDSAVDSVVTMETSGISTRTFTNVAGCEVEEQTKIATFDIDVASDDEFRIYYSYTVEYHSNGSSTGAPILHTTWVIMPAGAKTVTKQIYHYIKADCPSSSGEIIDNGGEYDAYSSEA